MEQRLIRLRQQILHLERENHKPKYRKPLWNRENELMREKQQLEQDIYQITHKLDELKIDNKVKKQNTLLNKQDFEMKWKEIQDDEIQSFEQRMETMLYQEEYNEEIQQLTINVEELLKETKYELFIIKEEDD